MPKSGGVSNKEKDYRYRNRNKSIKRYFYGIEKELSPPTVIYQFSTLNFYTIVKSTLDASISFFIL